MLLLASTSWVGVRFLINLISNIYFSSLCVFGGDGNDDDVGGGVCVNLKHANVQFHKNHSNPRERRFHHSTPPHCNSKQTLILTSLQSNKRAKKKQKKTQSVNTRRMKALIYEWAKQKLSFAFEWKEPKPSEGMRWTMETALF